MIADAADVRFEITANPEPDQPGDEYLLEVIELPGPVWHVETVIDSFFTSDPGGFIEAWRERQAMPDLETRLAHYAAMGL